jgi:hypothetical protein
MTASAVLSALRDRGFELTVIDDGVRVTPASRLTDADRAALRAHKAALVALLSPPTTPCFLCKQTRYWWREAGNVGDWICGACHPDPRRLAREEASRIAADTAATRSDRR